MGARSRRFTLATDVVPPEEARDRGSAPCRREDERYEPQAAERPVRDRSGRRRVAGRPRQGPDVRDQRRRPKALRYMQRPVTARSGLLHRLPRRSHARARSCWTTPHLDRYRRRVTESAPPGRCARPHDAPESSARRLPLHIPWLGSKQTTPSRTGHRARGRGRTAPPRRALPGHIAPLADHSVSAVQTRLRAIRRSVVGRRAREKMRGGARVPDVIFSMGAADVPFLRL